MKYSKKQKWHLNKHALLSAIHFSLQYWDWKEEYDALIEKGAGGLRITDDIKAKSVSSPTERDGLRAVELSEKIRKIEQSAEEAGGVFYKWLLVGVTKEYTSYLYLSEKMRMPCGKDKYYAMRRHFFWILNKKI